MRTKLKILGVLMLLIASAFTASAYDFYVNDIYYTITSGKKVEVTYRDKNYKSYSGSVTIPASVTYDRITYKVTSIGYRAFYNSSGLTSVTIPNSVTSIGNRAFYGCSGLTAVHITDLAAWCKIKFGDSDANPLNNAHDLYLNYEKVTNLVIPNSVTSIGYGAFYGCSGLTSVTIPNSVTEIGKSAFYGCHGLIKSAYPNHLSNPFSEGISISYDANNSIIEDGFIYNADKTTLYFAPCDLTSVTIPNSVMYIGHGAFAGCSELTSLTIPNKVRKIGENAFYKTFPKEIYTYPGNPPSIYDNTFEGETYNTAFLYVPKGCIEAYENHGTWGKFFYTFEGNYNGVDDVIADEASGEIVGYYNLQGVRSDDPWKGLNIVVYSDGTRRKIKY